MYGLDISNLTAQVVGDDLKLGRLRNTLTQPGFVLTSEGVPYEELVSAALTEINPTEYPEGFDLSDGQLAYYNLDLAKQYADQAKEELSAEGVEFPIQLDISVDGASEKGVRVAQAFKNTLETNLTDFVAVNIIVSDTDTLNAAKKLNK